MGSGLVLFEILAQLFGEWPVRAGIWGSRPTVKSLLAVHATEWPERNRKQQESFENAAPPGTACFAVAAARACMG
jgi:hypothetical protein